MIKREEDRTLIGGTAILFFLYIFLVAANLQNSHNSNVEVTFQYQTATFNSFAVPSRDIPQLSSLLGFVSLLDEIYNNHFNEYLKLLTDNRLINLELILRRKVELIIKPVILQKLYCCHLLKYYESLPVLS